jgi:microcystin-dependent protein
MTYKVEYTESNNPAKPPVVVQDQSLNNQTSLTFVGQNYSGYAPIVAKDFLHLLENFASPFAPGTDPNNPMGLPIQGQLWYDTNSNTLKVWDGTTWNTAGSLKKAGTAPEVASSLQGDLWVDTDSSQLYLFSGSNWLLIGPQFSQGTKTGPIVENIVDTSNITHSVVTLYSAKASDGNSYRISIISKDTFTPKISIDGFSKIYQGVTLSSTDSTLTTDPTRFHGTASSADALLINNAEISATNFLRSDTSSVTNWPISIRSNAGLSIGSDLNFNIGTNGNSTIFYSKNSTSSGSSNNVAFNFNSNNVTKSVLYLDATGKIGAGFNNSAPQTTFDVAGAVTIKDDIASSISGILNITGTTDSTFTAGSLWTTATGSIVTQGGLSVAKNSNFGGSITSYGNILLNNLIGSTPTAGPVILPATDSASGLYDIGSATRKFRNIYANSFVGTFNGSFTGSLAGSVNGSAAKLASPTVFSVAGDVLSDQQSFDGLSSTGTLTLTTTINPTFISGKTEPTDSQANDYLLVYRSGTGLLKMTKQKLLNHVATVPVGCIFPFAGTIVPTGYLLCDGSEVQVKDYGSLFSIIGYTYKSQSLLQGYNTFALPDLRGRFALGKDNMNNGLQVPYKDNSGTQVSAGGGAANRVSDITATTLGATSGHQSVTLSLSNLPDHKHNLSSGYAQYYAAGIPGASTDQFASNNVSLAAPSGTGQGQAIANSGGLISSQTGSAINIMNPYETINYIIFTGVI